MLSTVRHAVLYAAVIGCAAAIALMLAPGWERAGLIVMVASAMLAMVDVPGMPMRWAQIFSHARPLIPLALLAMLIVVHGVVRGSIEGVEYYLAKYLGGIACFAAFFIVMSQARRDLQVDAILLAMIGGLLTHLALFGVDLLIHLRGGTSTGPALFALAPRVGRKMLSIALTCLLPFSVAGWHIFKEYALWRIVCGTVAALTLLALSVIDTRAALLSMLIAAMIFATSSMVRKGFRAAMVVIFASRGRIASLAFVAILTVFLVFYSGAHRLERLTDSVVSALHADSSQAWITQDAWVPEFCQEP